MDERVKNRVRLWLHSERAFGLTSVPAPDVQDIPAIPLSGAAGGPFVVGRKGGPAAAPLSNSRSVVSTPDTNLFGVSEIKPPPPLMPPPSVETFTAPPLSAEEKRKALIAMDSKEVRGCTRCRLCEKRTNTVFGEG